MLRSGITLSIVFAMVVMPFLGQGHLAAAQDSEALLAFPEAVAIETLASGVVNNHLSGDESIVLERVVLPAGGITVTRPVDVIEVLYVEQGALVLSDSIGLRSTLGEGKAVYLRAGASYQGENEGAAEAVFLRLSISASPAQETAVASPVANPVDEVFAGDEVVTELANMSLAQAGHLGSTLHISRAVLQPGETSGEFALSESMTVIVQEGTLTVASPSGLDGQLNAGNLVVLPVNQALTFRNDGEAEVSVMLVGIASADQPAISEPIPTPTPEPPTPTSEAAGEDVAEPAAESDSELDISEGAILYEANASGGFENWPTAGGWHLVSGMLVNDGTGESAVVALAPTDIPISDYAIEAEIQWNRDGRSFGVVGRWSDGNGYQAGYETYQRHARSRIKLWGIDNRYEIAEADLPLDTNWHLYRVEVRGNIVKVYVDGGLIIETSDNSFLSPGQAGVWSNGAQINLRSFKIISLASASSQDSIDAEAVVMPARTEGRRHARIQFRGVR